MATREGTLPLEERMQIAKDQLASGLSQSQFAEKHGIPVGKIGGWVNAYKIANGIPRQKRKPYTRPSTKKKDANDIASRASKASEETWTSVINGYTKAEPRTSQALVNNELQHAKQEVAGLQAQVGDLMEQLDDAHAKIEALQEVIVVMGHQMVGRR